MSRQFALLQDAVQRTLSQDERAFLSAALHTEGVLTNDNSTEQRIRVKLGLEEH